MSDFAAPNAVPGQCVKCNGSGEYRWGAAVNGKPSKSGPCHSCGGTGTQTRRDIARNNAYNRYKLACEAA
jgi:DnaJ-class molecular chaperone